MAYIEDSNDIPAFAGGARVEDYFALLKPRVMSLVVFTAIVGLLLAPGGIHPVLGFIAISVLATAGFFTHGQLNSLSNLSRWAFLPAFAGVGVRTNLRDLVGQGWRPLIVGILGEIFIALVTLGLVYWSYRHGAIQ